MKEIHLSKTGKNKNLYKALVDDEIYDYLMLWNWSVKQTPSGVKYAYRKDNSGDKLKNIYMHQVVCEYCKIEIPKGQTPDHIDRDGLNNQKANLRAATKTEQAINRGMYSNNTSKTKGVSFDKATNKWLARITINKKMIYLGLFDDIEMAKQVRHTAETMRGDNKITDSTEEWDCYPYWRT